MEDNFCIAWTSEKLIKIKQLTIYGISKNVWMFQSAE